MAITEIRKGLFWLSMLLAAVFGPGLISIALRTVTADLPPCAKGEFFILSDCELPVEVRTRCEGVGPPVIIDRTREDFYKIRIIAPGNVIEGRTPDQIREMAKDNQYRCRY